MLGDRQGVRACAGSRIEDVDILCTQTALAAEAAAQDVVEEADLEAYDLHGGVVDAGVLAHFRVIRGKEVFVEVEPGIGFFGQFVGVDRADGGFEKSYCSFHCLSVGGLGHELEHRADQFVSVSQQ
ncbi:hypothetical protein CDES_14205 (plasmid) [Corynebacterium deserti GIMN1.010]|uniref:Uncharacterized protein n=1 Tax=Corynebacterium deserti GIMN1.010 TaxID=931089 RepID=A0A0M5IRP4_9CORY|nr:hypothetical protein CDES_14205 [Corynebacterium deserti GIMN1.010]